MIRQRAAIAIDGPVNWRPPKPRQNSPNKTDWKKKERREQRFLHFFFFFFFLITAHKIVSIG